MTTPITSAATTGTSNATDTAASSALGQLDSNAFLKLLVAQMRYQNPFSPSDPSAMLGQVATYAQVESLQKIQAGQASTATLEQARMAGEVIGRKVTGTDSVGTATSGIVASARFTASGPVLVLDSGKEMALANVETIAAATAAAAATTTAATTSATATGASTSATSVPAATRSSTSGQSTGGSGTSSSSATASSLATAAAARIVRAAIGAYDGAVAPSSAALAGRAA